MDFKSTIQRDVLPEEQPPTAWDASAAITSPSSNQTFPPPSPPPPPSPSRGETEDSRIATDKERSQLTLLARTTHVLGLGGIFFMGPPQD